MIVSGVGNGFCAETVTKINNQNINLKINMLVFRLGKNCSNNDEALTIILIVTPQVTIKKINQHSTKFYCAEYTITVDQQTIDRRKL